MDREEALMHAGRKRLRPILMTTFALIAGMLPVAIGVGEGGEFYRPMAVAIIGGIITSTLLTLLVIPSFYDSIEIARDRALAKFHAREARWNAVLRLRGHARSRRCSPSWASGWPGASRRSSVAGVTRRGGRGPGAAGAGGGRLR